MESGPNSVRAQLEKLDPKKQAKPLLLDMVANGQMDDVIMLLEGMKARSRDAILKTFTDEKELDTLHDIHSQMMSGKPTKPKIDAAIETTDSVAALISRA